MKTKTALTSSKHSRHIGDDPSLGVTPDHPGEVGPNGYPVGYNSNGDKVEWILSDKEDRNEFGEFSPMILRRNDAAIQRECNNLRDIVWWNRHQALMQQLVDGEGKPLPNQEQLLTHVQEVARQIETRIGNDNLVLDEFECGLLQGRMAALAWVQGVEWNESLDT